MKRFLSLICLMALALLIPSALLLSRGLPTDTQPYIEKKYSGWNGVLRAWICSKWSCSGSFTGWLNRCAEKFERGHDGVYLEFTPVSENVLRERAESGIRTPELIFFSPEVLPDAGGLLPLDAPDALRSDLRGCGEGCALPVALGGYVLVRNPNFPESEPTLPPDDDARKFSIAHQALTSGGGTSEEIELPELGVDLGLEASAGALIDAQALEKFTNGELSSTVVTQKELAKLIRLRDAGRGCDWECEISGQYAFTDQILFASVTASSDSDAQARGALAKAFLAQLLTDDAQALLADIGAFSVTGARIHPDRSGYAALDSLLNSRALIFPRLYNR